MLSMSARIGADIAPDRAAASATRPVITPRLRRTVDRTRVAKITVTTVVLSGHADDTVR
ncbi:hypothetical protein MINTMi198_30230 [Mycobacterium intracellulare M.i.198]|uniref:Uncharacterized protein n=1 Tax=Mycobacterium paraintracellulare TaxID=1138383 RepID=A0ABN6AXM8_9MYCO|nr:hypothetical protein MPRI_48590 [Mycobacterium paraintracellulare]BCO79369.1 hypothetical protein MINTM009_31510 [Mycobacterium intracellulare]BCP37653.1 hypothetical protein MINTMi198_30230 [Mycobacterium intracellulare M.i.198]BCO84454.1 hypothetical protein MINTM011_27890 [Mycobacterium paraintracellulare]BCP10694.1 hypothetical protein MINTM020_27920 [Mycobacterium paraintracellulare]